MLGEQLSVVIYPISLCGGLSDAVHGALEEYGICQLNHA